MPAREYYSFMKDDHAQITGVVRELLALIQTVIVFVFVLVLFICTLPAFFARRSARPVSFVLLARSASA